MGSGAAIIRKRQQLVKAELSGDNFNPDGVYGHNSEVAPYVPSAAPLPPGDVFSPKAQDEAINPSTSFVSIQQGQDSSQFLPSTTGSEVQITFVNGRPNVSLSIPSISYTEIANNFIQAILKGERPQLPTNIRTTASVAPPRDSSGDRGAAANIASPLSNATPNTVSTATEAGKIKLYG